MNAEYVTHWVHLCLNGFHVLVISIRFNLEYFGKSTLNTTRIEFSGYDGF